VCTAERKLIFPFNAIIAMTSFVQSTGYQKIIDVSSCIRSEQNDLVTIKLKEEKVLEDRVL
jgi:hypothetical protein